MNIHLTFAALNCFMAVGCGALGAHKLRDVLDSNAMHAFEVSTHYQLTHGLALIAMALCLQLWQQQKLFYWAANFFAFGLLLFCGSLYILSLTELRKIGPLPIGIVTPIGGVLFLLGWLTVIAASFNLAKH